MKATELLLKQHREIEQLLERLRNAAPEEERGVREELARLLVAHTTIEQEHFYPALREVAPDRVLEAIEEHGLADFELARDLSARAGEDAKARTTVLAETVLAHVRKEENDLFRRAESALTNQELSEIGDMMARAFEQVRRGPYERLLAQALAEKMPKMVLRGVTEKAGKSVRRGAAKKMAARRAAAPKAKRGTAKRGTAKRTTARKTEVARPQSKRVPAARPTTKRGAVGARGKTQRSPAAPKTRAQKGMRGAKSRTSR